ncbi:uncharacterized protein LOC114296432 [Camellia sinensis]|nr:uncharacterized protein LOC114296432 [Camellia sinensis]
MLKSGGRGNFQDDSILPENRVRSKDDIPPQDPKQNKRKGKPCKLAVGSIENTVAHGTVYERIEPNEPIHTVPLGESNVRVSIEVVIQKDAPLPIPISDEMLIVGEAVGFFVAWPKNLVLVGDEDEEDLRIWREMSALVERMCWKIASKKNQTVIWVKPLTNDCYMEREPGTQPPLCRSDEDPDATWGVLMEPCITRYSDLDIIQSSVLVDKNLF